MDRAKCYKCGSERVVGSVNYCGEHTLGSGSTVELRDEGLPEPERLAKMREAFEMIMKHNPKIMIIYADVDGHEEGAVSGEGGRVFAAALGPPLEIIALDLLGSKAIAGMINRSVQPGMNG